MVSGREQEPRSALVQYGSVRQSSKSGGTSGPRAGFCRRGCLIGRGFEIQLTQLLLKCSRRGHRLRYCAGYQSLLSSDNTLSSH